MKVLEMADFDDEEEMGDEEEEGDGSEEE